MKAISLWQPWATAMWIGIKQNETRSWPIAYRGDLVICAAKRPMDVVAREMAEYIRQVAGPQVFQLGVALCVVEVVAVHHITETPRDNVEAALGDYSPGRFAWVTRNLRRLKKPIPVIGRQGLFDVQLSWPCGDCDPCLGGRPDQCAISPCHLEKPSPDKATRHA